MTSGRRTNRSSEQVRRDLRDTTVRLARERGLAAVTYRDIATEAGVSDSVLLRHFGTKNDLVLDAVVEPFTSTLVALAGPDSVAALYDHLSANRDVVRMLIAAESTSDDDPTLVAARNRMREALAAFDGPLARALMAMMIAVTALDDVLYPRGAPARGEMVAALAGLTAHGRAGTR